MVHSRWFYRVLVWFTVDGFTGFWSGLQWMVLQGCGMIHSGFCLIVCFMKIMNKITKFIFQA